MFSTEDHCAVILVPEGWFEDIQTILERSENSGSDSDEDDDEEEPSMNRKQKMLAIAGAVTAAVAAVGAATYAIVRKFTK